MPKHGDRKQDDNGFLEWHQPDENWPGYWSRVEDEELTKFRVPLACPACGTLLDNWKATYFHRWGVCSDCYYDHLEGKDDLPKMNNEDRAAYCKIKNEEKKNK